MDWEFPFHIDSRGRTAVTNKADHIRNMIELFLFTNPGERVNRPEFGSGLLQLIFAPNSPELTTGVQFTVQAGLQQWLGDLIEVQDLKVNSEEATLSIDITYIIRQTGQQDSFTLTRSL